MIKCFIVQNISEPENKGVFKENKFYIAKISSRGINMVSVLDNKGNWVPFKWIRSSILDVEMFDRYFDIWDEFLIENKKELNKYVPLTKFYE